MASFTVVAITSLQSLWVPSSLVISTASPISTKSLALTDWSECMGMAMMGTAKFKVSIMEFHPHAHLLAMRKSKHPYEAHIATDKLQSMSYLHYVFP
nr:hypothetical protein Iba_scaffold397825CG0010 [Ipomoea batatas]